MRIWILRLGVIAATLAVLESFLKLAKTEDFCTDAFAKFTCEFFQQVVRVIDPTLPFIHGLVILAPIAISVLTAGAIKFDRGTSWVLLRSTAEAIKSEIYRYRSQVGSYADSDAKDVNFAHQLQSLSERLMKTQVNQRGIEGVQKHQLKNAVSPQDTDLNAPLTPQAYIQCRLQDQLSFYRSRIRKLYKRSQQFYWSIYILGGISSFLAAINLGIWVAVVTTLSGALLSYLEIKQIDTTLINYNQAATNLENIIIWWNSLTPKEKDTPLNYEKLVDSTEKILGLEATGWVQEMQNALAELYQKDQQEIEKKVKEKEAKAE